MSSVYQTTVIPKIEPMTSRHQSRETVHEYFESLSKAVNFAVDESDEGDWVEVSEVIQDATGEYEKIVTVLNFQVTEN